MLLKVSASYADLHLFTPNSAPLPHPEAVTLSFTLWRNNTNELQDLRSKILTTNVSSMNRNPTRDKLPHWQDQAHCQARAQGESRQEIAN